MTALPLPEGLWVLSSVSRLVGVDDPIQMLKEFKQFIDTDQLRRVATEVWGTSAGPSATGRGLEELAPDMMDTFLRTVENRWQGDAYEAYGRYVEGIRKALFQEADRLPQIGDVLVAVADGIELTWLEMIGAAISAAGVVLSIQSVLEVGPTLLGLLGLIISLIGGAISVVSIERPRVALLAEHGSVLDNNDYARGDSAIFELPSITGRPGGWTPKTADPYR